jgi:hypothetical protein
MRAELAHVVTIADKSDEVRAVTKPLRDAQCDVPASYEQNALHRTAGVTNAPEDPRARASSDPAQEPSMLMPTQPQ